MLGGKAMAKKNTAAIAEELAAPILEEMGLQLWDVVYAVSYTHLTLPTT